MRPIFSRLASDRVSAEHTTLRTEEPARSIPVATARFARCSAKLDMPMNTVGFSVWISRSCTSDGQALPAPAQTMPTSNSCELRAQTWPAG